MEKFISEFVHSGSTHACLGDVDQSLVCQLILLFSDSLIYKYVDRKSNLIILYTYDRTRRIANYISGMGMMRSYVQYNMTERLTLNIAKRLIFLLNV